VECRPERQVAADAEPDGAEATAAGRMGFQRADHDVHVAVDQAQAERLVHAVQTGTLYLALVNDSTTVTPGPGVTNKSLFN
jgi:pilus assembly protein CpaB